MEQRWASLLLLLSFVAATSNPSGPPRVFTLRPTTTEEVPTFFHLTKYTGLICNGTAFTDSEARGCHGWHGISEFDCEKKCLVAGNAGEQLDSCPNKLCFAISYHEGGGGWCHLYDHANCLGMKYDKYVTSFKKEHGSTGGMPSINTSNIDLRAVAMAAGAALVAAAEMSARHRARMPGNLSSAPHLVIPDALHPVLSWQPVAAGAHDHSHLITTTPLVAAVAHDHSHLSTNPPPVYTSGRDHSPLITNAPLAEIFTTTPLGAAGGHDHSHLITTTPVAGYTRREGHDPALLITNMPPVVNSNPVPAGAVGASPPTTPASFLHAADGNSSQRGVSTSGTSSFATPHALIVIPGLLVLCVCCCLLGQALSKRKERSEGGATDGLGDSPTRYPNDME